MCAFFSYVLFYLYARVLFVCMFVWWLRRAIFCVFVSWCPRRVLLWLSVCVVYLCALFVYFVLFMCVRVLFVYVVLNQYVFVRVFVCVFFQRACSLTFEAVTRYGQTIWSANHSLYVICVQVFIVCVGIVCVCIMCVYVFIGMHVCVSMHFCVCIFVCVHVCIDVL